MNFLSEKLRSIHGLPDNWKIYALSCLPKNEKTTHVEIKGALTRPIKTGRRKGADCWLSGPDSCKRTFILSHSEYRSYSKPFEQANN